MYRLILSLLMTLAVSAPAAAVDAPDGCPDTWPLKLEFPDRSGAQSMPVRISTIETTGLLAAAQKAFGTRLAITQTVEKKAGSFLLTEANQYWSPKLVFSALQSNRQIEVVQTLTIKKEGCTNVGQFRASTTINLTLREIDRPLSEWLSVNFGDRWELKYREEFVAQAQALVDKLTSGSRNVVGRYGPVPDRIQTDLRSGVTLVTIPESGSTCVEYKGENLVIAPPCTIKVGVAFYGYQDFPREVDPIHVIATIPFSAAPQSNNATDTAARSAATKRAGDICSRTQLNRIINVGPMKLKCSLKKGSKTPTWLRVK